MPSLPTALAAPARNTGGKARLLDGDRRIPARDQTVCWREMDSNFQYAGAVNLFVAPFVVPGCLKSPPATRSRRKRQGPFQGLRVPRHPAQEDVVGGSAGTAPHDLPVASVRCLYCFCPSHFASVGEHRSYAVKRSGGYIRNHRPSEQRRLSRLRQRPGRSAGCRSDPSNRARQKARQNGHDDARHLRC